LNRTLTGIITTTLTAAALAGCGSTHSQHPAATPSPAPPAKASASRVTKASVTEYASGAISGNTALAGHLSIPLDWTGPVATSGVFTTTGGPRKGEHHVFVTAAGDLAAVITSVTGRKPDLLSQSTCATVYTTTVQYTVDGIDSTRVFAGASGHGTATVTFQGDMPKKNGACDTASSATPPAATATAEFASTTTLRLASKTPAQAQASPAPAPSATGPTPTTTGTTAG